MAGLTGACVGPYSKWPGWDVGLSLASQNGLALNLPGCPVELRRNAPRIDKGSMTDASLAPQWIDVSQADDLRDVIHRAVACLAQGGVVGLATETVYALGGLRLECQTAWPG